MAERPDVAIVGAGSAGISAARHLMANGRSVLLIDALPRLGGRAHTCLIDNMPLDMGCGWLHSAQRNPLMTLARSQGRTIDQSESAWSRQLNNIAFTAEQQYEAWQAFETFQQRLRTHPPLSDRAADALPATDRWRPFADGLSSFMNGTELDQLSAIDFMAYEDASTDDNWRLPEGYGAFIADLAAGIPTALGTRVASIAIQDDIVIETDRGTIHAASVIVTASTNVLARGDIRFGPEASDHLHAAAQLPLGLADKIFLSLADPDAVPAESHLLGSIDRAGTGSYYIRPLGRPIIECFLGGACARDLETRGKDAAFDFAIGELKGLLGGDFARTLTPLVRTHWGDEPTIGGSYSHALPGQAGARDVLAQPVSERLCFAGEACSKLDFSTAHGAWESGIAAADHIENFLAKGPTP